LSAQANILAGRYVSESKTSSGDRTVLDEMRQRVKRLMHDLVSLCEARRQEHWRSLQTARAVALSAYARVLDADGDGMEAAAKLYEALAAEPDFVDARLQLAKLHMKYRRALSNEWPLRARLYLLSAMQLNPNCEDAQLLLAELYSDPAVDQISEAEHLLTALTSGDKHNTAAYLQLARLKLRTSKPEAGKIEATEQLCLHIRVSGTFSESADYVFNEILEGTAAWNALRSHLSRVSDALRLVRDGAPKTALDERARIARAMAAIDGLQIAESQAQGAAV
jgi:TPR repeat protein